MSDIKWSWMTRVFLVAIAAKPCGSYGEFVFHFAVVSLGETFEANAWKLPTPKRSSKITLARWRNSMIFRQFDKGTVLPGRFCRLSKILGNP